MLMPIRAPIAAIDFVFESIAPPASPAYTTAMGADTITSVRANINTDFFIMVYPPYYRDILVCLFNGT
jgi:hypothetical protein